MSQHPNLIASEFRALLPTLAFALLLPVPAVMFWEDGASRAFAFAYLFLGCGFMSAERFSGQQPVFDYNSIPSSSRFNRTLWRSKMAALALASLIAVIVFCVVWFAFSGTIDSGVPIIALLSVMPALFLVPCFALRTRHTFTAVLLSALLLASIKIIGCVVVRFVYGPNALENGYMVMEWDASNLLVALCIAGMIAYSAIFFELGRRQFLAPQSSTPSSSTRSGSPLFPQAKETP
jgi:hypothetical protein